MRRASFFVQFSRRSLCPSRTIFQSVLSPSRYQVARPIPPLRGKRSRPSSSFFLAAALSPAAFIRLSEEEHRDGESGERHMLEASREEISLKIPEDSHGIQRVWISIVVVFDRYIYEPIATSLRFLHLMVIFVPVVVVLPVLWVGRRQGGRHDERTGTLWWYGYLVRSMERAGPAFIKVCTNPSLSLRPSWRIPGDLNFDSLLHTARTMGRVSHRYLSHRDV